LENVLISGQDNGGDPLVGLGDLIAVQQPSLEDECSATGASDNFASFSVELVLLRTADVETHQLVLEVNVRKNFKKIYFKLF
jgi:hypothetical protein